VFVDDRPPHGHVPTGRLPRYMHARQRRIKMSAATLALVRFWRAYLDRDQLGAAQQTQFIALATRAAVSVQLWTR
jgi:hypothetical protein